MTDLNTLALGLLDTEQFFLGKPEYERITLDGMRDNVLKRAQETLSALEAYNGGVLDAPMAWTARNAIAIKIGYGAKNEALWTFKDVLGNETDVRRANGRTREEQRLKALNFFISAIPAIEAGSLDAEIQEKLVSYQVRAEAGKAVRKSNAAKRAAVKAPRLAAVA